MNLYLSKKNAKAVSCFRIPNAPGLSDLAAGFSFILFRPENPGPLGQVRDDQAVPAITVKC